MTRRKSRSTYFSVLLAAALAASAIVAAPATATHGGSPSPELNVVGQADADELGVFGENVTDVWAAQSSSNGRDYAYLGSFDDIACTLDTTGTHIVDITDPTAPTKVAFIADKPATRTNDVKVAHLETPNFIGEILVASNEPCGSQFVPRLNSNGVSGNAGRGGVAIWDVSDPTNPKALRQNYLDFGVHNSFIWQQGNNAYMLLVDDNNVQDVHIVDITKPRTPKEIAVTGQLDWPTLSDNIGVGEVFLHDVWVQDNGGTVIAYLSYWDAGLVLLDVTDPANPVFLGDSEYLTPDPLSGESPEGNSHVAVPNADGTRVLMGDEDFAAGQLTKFEFDGTPYAATEGGFTPQVFAPPFNGAFSDPVHWTGGEGCTADEFDRAAIGSEVALIQRGTCFFSTKAANAEALGYSGFIVANNAGDGLISMSSGTNDVITIPGFFVGQSTGEIMKGVPGGIVDVEAIFDGMGYLRLLDVSDPANILELDQFATENVFANPPVAGDTTMHNVVVNESTTAYISWYAEGLRVVDFSGDVLTETAHFVDTVDGSNFWGVYLYEHSDNNTYILGSDRTTGLWIFDTP